MNSLAYRAAFAAAVVSLHACALLPDTASLAVAHQSQPMHGSWAPPMGNHGATAETNFEGVEAGTRWERGRWFAETDMLYVVHQENLVGGPWIFTARAGVQVRLP